MTPKNDQVFQLSLTEIAFTVSFILLLLLGYVVTKEQAAREKAERELASIGDTERLRQALSDAQREFSAAASKSGIANPDEIVTRMVAAESAKADRDRMKKKVEELDAQLSAMTELKRMVEAASAESRQELAASTVRSALALQAEVAKDIQMAQSQTETRSAEPAMRAAAFTAPIASNPASTKAVTANYSHEETLARVRRAFAVEEKIVETLKRRLERMPNGDEEANAVEAMVIAARRYDDSVKAGVNIDGVRKENSDLRGQVAYFKRRLEARGGRDYPPCWADESGKPEFLLSIDLTPTAVTVQPAWPAIREADARTLPNIEAVLAGATGMDSFVRNVQGIFRSSQRADPQCRHYVFIKSSIADARDSDRARLTVENYFYKSEIRR